jgi:hypothetical protein
MAITAYGLEHLPQNFAIGSYTTCFGMANSDLKFNCYWGGSGNFAALRPYNGNMMALGKLQGNTAQCAGLNTLQFSALTPGGTPNKFTLAFRVTRFNAPSADQPIFSITNGTTTAGDGLLPIIYSRTTDAVGVATYYEVTIDLNALTWVVFTNNVQTSSGALPTSITKANFRTLYWQIGTISTYYMILGGDLVVHGLSDIITVVDYGTAGDTAVNRLGPVVLNRLPVVSTTGTSTPPSGSTTVDALNTKRSTSAALTAPVVALAADLSPLRVKMDTTTITGLNVLGLTVRASATKDLSTANNVSLALAYGGTTTAATAMPLTAGTMSYDTRLPAAIALPDGTAYSPTSLAGLEIVVTPTAP